MAQKLSQTSHYRIKVLHSLGFGCKAISRQIGVVTFQRVHQIISGKNNVTRQRQRQQRRQTSFACLDAIDAVRLLYEGKSRREIALLAGVKWGHTRLYLLDKLGVHSTHELDSKSILDRSLADQPR